MICSPYDSLFHFLYGSLLSSWRRIGLLAFIILAVGCTNTTDIPPVKIESTQTEDGAPTQDKDVSKIADAVPKPVKRTIAGNKSPYTVFGKTYTLLPDSKGYQEKGYASWYGTKFHGRYTANGEIYDMWGMTAAHKTLPIPSYVRVVNAHNGKSIIVRVNDRGPFHSDRIIDLSYAAAKKLGFAEKGVALVEVTDVTPDISITPIASSSNTSVQVLETEEQQSITVLPPTPATVDVKPEAMPKAIPKSTLKSTKVDTSADVQKPVTIQQTTLQVGAFKQKASAQKLQAKLSQALPVPVKVVSTPGSPWHRVRVGPINDQQSLNTTKQLLIEQGINKPQVVK